ncbi:hypothetical protein N7463_002010 [Penicillium fimorum]|uniref:Bubble protein n=1 Tax=Penicillium fimorum TaxID=1882269 RepID=A0A9W9XYJ6_9EURO|nr:hypothetical protein N7463_002010 [Penicillium fimorum]
MKFTAMLFTLMAATAVSASVLEARDGCGSSYDPDQRRTNSPCQSSNGSKQYCGCDRTGIVQCKSGKWKEVLNCGKNSCHGGEEGGAKC